MNDTWVDEIKEKWEIYGVEMNEGASIEEIKKAEVELDFTFPTEFYEFYFKINGFKNLDWLENSFGIWPLERIVEEYQDNSNKDFIGFADYSLDVHQIGFLRKGEGIYKYEEAPEQIAATFKEAVKLIDSDDEIIY